MTLTRYLVLSLLIFSLHSAVRADPYADVTNGRGAVITPAYFGVHLHRLVVQPADHAVETRWPELDFGSLRLWDSGTRWADIAPSAGTWNFERLDKYVGTANSHNASVLYTLGSPPRWASARPDEACPYGLGCAAEAARAELWEDYVRHVAARYGNKIAAYELWNEPKLSDIGRDRNAAGFYSGSVAQLVSMAKSARTVLDAVAPKALLCTPGFTNGPDRLELFLAAGGAKYVQAVCYHFYAGNSGDFVRQVGAIRTIMKRYGVERLPLWNTETGVEVHATSNAATGMIARTHEDATAFLSQLLILGAASGIEHFYYYAWDNFISGMVAPDGAARPGLQTMQRLQGWLIGARLTGCKSTDDIVQCEGIRGSDHFLIAWAGTDRKRSINAPSGWRAVAVDSLDGDAAAHVTATIGTSEIQLGPLPVRLRLARSTAFQ